MQYTHKKLLGLILNLLGFIILIIIFPTWVLYGLLCICTGILLYLVFYCTLGTVNKGVKEMKWRIWLRYRKHLFIPMIMILIMVFLMVAFLPPKAWLGLGAVGLMGIGINMLRK